MRVWCLSRGFRAKRWYHTTAPHRDPPPADITVTGIVTITIIRHQALDTDTRHRSPDTRHETRDTRHQAPPERRHQTRYTRARSRPSLSLTLLILILAISTISVSIKDISSGTKKHNTSRAASSEVLPRETGSLTAGGSSAPRACGGVGRPHATHGLTSGPRSKSQTLNPS